MLRSYYIDHCYSAQIEASALLSLRIGYTAIGIATRRFQAARRERPWYQHILPLFALTLGTHTGQNDIRWLFRLTVLGWRIGYTRPGPLTDHALHSAQSLGWSVR